MNAILVHYSDSQITDIHYTEKKAFVKRYSIIVHFSTFVDKKGNALQKAEVLENGHKF
jgi:hypothetical protein